MKDYNYLKDYGRLKDYSFLVNICMSKTQVYPSLILEIES
ncbi:hypothetical protein S7335_4354 [Synechococcus sp. PCC 7335]|nr:hypothetical protein S7335_4354 [Synechococcus sp. PCC 7335]